MTKEKQDPKLLWKKTKNILRKAIHSEGSYIVDTVRVKIDQHDIYLQELAQNKHIHGNVTLAPIPYLPKHNNKTQGNI